MAAAILAQIDSCGRVVGWLVVQVGCGVGGLRSEAEDEGSKLRQARLIYFSKSKVCSCFPSSPSSSVMDGAVLLLPLHL